MPAHSQFAQDAADAVIASAQHERLKDYGVWIWKSGTIEDVLGIAGKWEEATQQLEQELPKLSTADLEAKHPNVVEFLGWLAN